MDTATINNPPGCKEADTATADRRLRIYVCSPYRPRMEPPELAKRELADNIDRAKTACRLVAELGAVPICSHLFCTQFLDDSMLSAYKLGTMIKISNELLNDSAFDLATYIAQRFGVRMGNAEEKAFITGDGVGKPTGLLDEAGAQVGVTAAAEDAVTFDEIFQLYYSLKSPYRRKAQFLCNEALVLQLMTIKDNNGNYIWKPGLDIGKPDTLLNRPLKTSAFMPAAAAGNKAMVFGDYSYYWIADRTNRTFRRLNELYARTDQVGFLTTQRVDGKLILPEAVKCLQMKAGA